MVNTWKQKIESISIIVMMDANGDSSNKHFTEFIRETFLYDVVDQNPPSLVGQRIYINGQKWLDCILLSEDLLGSCNSTGHTIYS